MCWLFALLQGGKRIRRPCHLMRPDNTDKVQIVLKICGVFSDFLSRCFVYHISGCRALHWTCCFHDTAPLLARRANKSCFFCRFTKESQSVTRSVGSLSNQFHLFFLLLWKIGGWEGRDSPTPPQCNPPSISPLPSSPFPIHPLLPPSSPHTSPRPRCPRLIQLSSQFPVWLDPQ